MTLPSSAQAPADVLAPLQEYRAGDLPARGGRTFAYVYDAGRPDIDALAHEVYASMLDVNGLDPTVFPSLFVMENDVVDIARRHLGSATAVGSFTSGGTESIILAVKAARDRAGIEGGQV